MGWITRCVDLTWFYLTFFMHPAPSTVAQNGYIDDYQGVRISSTGKRFMIRQCIVWEVFDAGGVRRGQAATFDDIEPL